MALEKHWIARGFSAAAVTYDAAAQIQYQAALELLVQIEFSGVQPQRLLDVGCGTGRVTQELAHYWQQPVIGIDCASGMITYAQQQYAHPLIHYICSEIEKYSFEPDQYDLIFSNFALQWCEDLADVFKQLAYGLAQDGLLAFTLPGEQTLNELKSIWRGIDGYDHVNDFVSAVDLEQQLSAAGVQVISLTQEKKIHWHPDVQSIVRSLRGVGVHNVHNTRAPGLTGKKQWQALMQAYEAYRVPNQGLPVTYDIISVIVKKG